MAWGELELVSRRLEFVKLALQPDANLTELVARYDISRKTAYKWINRYLEEGKSGLADRSKRPTRSPNTLSDDWVAKICEVRKKHPAWGGLKIQVVLQREAGVEVPSARTIQRVLKAHGLADNHAANRLATKRFEHEAPNHLWQMDFKGHFPYETGRCHPLTILDDHSRFSIALNAYADEKGETIRPGLIEAFERYGLPDRINVDNGPPWGSLYDSARYTTFSLWLIRHGVKVSYSRPRHPQTNGKEERFHRTLKAEVLNHSYFRDLAGIQNRFDEWRDIYNLERPHQGIGMEVPMSRYRVSYRGYEGEAEGYEYASDYDVRRIDCRGRLVMNGRNVFVGMPFSREELGVRESPETGLLEIYYHHQKLGEVDLRKIEKGSMVNLYSGKLLST